METITLRAEVAAKLIGKNPDELKGLLEGVDENEISDKYASAVAQNFAGLREKIVKDKYSQGFKEKGQAIEAVLNPLFTKYGIADFDTAEKGIQLLAEEMEKDGSKTIDLSTLKPEELKEHAFVVKLQQQVDNLTKAKEAAEQEFALFKSNQQRVAATNAALNATISLFEKGNAITGNASKADAAKMYLNTIPVERLGLDDSGNPVILDSNGQPETDEFGKPVSFGDYVRSTYTFGFNAADPNKTGSGAGAGKSGGGGSSSIVIRSQEEGGKIVKAAYESGDKTALANARKAYDEFLTKQD